MANNGEPGNRHACAACKHQRRKCSPDCVFPPYFPGNMSEEFQSVLKVFGVSNLSKILKSIDPQDREEAVKSILWEAARWEQDPVRGPLGAFRMLEQELELLKNQQIKDRQLIITQQKFLPYVTDSGLIGLRTGERESGIIPHNIADANTAMYYSNAYQNIFMPREEIKSQGIDCIVPHYVTTGQGQEKVNRGTDVIIPEQPVTMAEPEEIGSRIIVGSSSNISSINFVPMDHGALSTASQGRGYANSCNAANRPHQGTNYNYKAKDKGLMNIGTYGTNCNYNGKDKGIINSGVGQGEDKGGGFNPTSYQEVSQVRGYSPYPYNNFTQRRDIGQNNDGLIIQQQHQQLVYPRRNTNQSHSIQDQNIQVKHDNERGPST